MKIEIDDNKISLDGEDGRNSCVIMEKPEVDDCSNITVRPLVANYHLEQETIWERSCRFMRELQDACKGSAYLACYGLLFEQLYPVLLSGSQAKNIICYGVDAEERENMSGLFQDFIAFLQKNSSFILLPESPFAFSALLNKSCHAAVVSLDTCASLQIICDAASKLRNGGKLLLYTKKDDVPEELSALLNHACKREFASCAVYSIKIDESVSSYAYENNSEAEIMPAAGLLIHKLGELKNLTSAMESGAECPLEAYPYAVELLSQMEGSLLDLYDVLENPELPVLANLLKEAVMDCYIGAAGRLEEGTYFDRMRRDARFFYEKMSAEFEN